jgi:aminoglycoside 6'-N-acetyltransferase I
MKIRKATKKDLKEIANIHLIETAKKPYQQLWTEKTASEKIRELFRYQDIFIPVEGKNILGFISIKISLGSKGKSALIDELWLKEEWQGKGIGKKLIRFIESYYKKENVRTICLVSDKRSKAFGFYKKLKFKPHFEDVLMAKRIG